MGGGGDGRVRKKKIWRRAYEWCIWSRDSRSPHAAGTKKMDATFFFLGGGDLRRKRVHDGVDAVGDKPKKEKRCGALRVW